MNGYMSKRFALQRSLVVCSYLNLSLSFLFASRNNLLWAHTVVAVFYLILTVFVLRRHTSQVQDISREMVSLCLLTTRV